MATGLISHLGDEETDIIIRDILDRKKAVRGGYAYDVGADE